MSGHFTIRGLIISTGIELLRGVGVVMDRVKVSLISSGGANVVIENLVTVSNRLCYG